MLDRRALPRLLLLSLKAWEPEPQPGTIPSPQIPCPSIYLKARSSATSPSSCHIPTLIPIWLSSQDSCN